MTIISQTVYLIQCSGSCGRWLNEPEGPGGPQHWLSKPTGATRYRTGEAVGEAARRLNRKQGRRAVSLTSFCADCLPR
jgi:hypothetical protein